MPARDLELLGEAARAAGEIALGFWRRYLQSWEKDAGAGPVSEADLAVNRMLEGRLRGARAEYGWLSEETEDDPARLSCPRCFIIDPIDGTRAFIAGEKTFAHSLAVAEAGRVIAAVVHLPALDLTYAAAEGMPATLNGKPVTVSRRTRLQGAVTLTSRHSLAPDHWKEATPPPVKRDFRASIAYRLCLVAQGRFDAMLSLWPTWEWDVAAGDLIARQAGATVTDRLGRAPVYNDGKPQVQGIIAAPPPLHRALIERLRPWPG